MLTNIKAWLYGLLFVALALGGWYLHHSGFAQGVASVTASDNAAQVVAGNAVASQAGKTKDAEQAQASKLVLIDSTYQAKVSHASETATPFLAAVRDGSLGLRQFGQCPQGPGGGSVPGAAKRKITVPAPITGTGRPDGTKPGPASDWPQVAIAVVRAGYDADGREQALDAKVEALQAVVTGYYTLYQSALGPAPASSAGSP